MEMCGLYCIRYFPQYAQFWKDCGIDTLQLAVSGTDHQGSEADYQAYLQMLRNEVAQAHEMGFKIYIGLLSNFRMTEGKEQWYQALFPIQDETELQKRLDVLRDTTEACKDADGFSIFAGDPGGYVGLTGNATVRTQYVYMCQEFIRTIRSVVPDAPVNITPWSVTSFETPVLGPGQVEFWQAENRHAAELLQVEGLFGPDVGIEFPCHNYYRPLALRLYKEAGLDVDVFPMPQDVAALEQKGCTRRWSWPYFLIDECDDGDGAGAGLQLETRYLCQLVQQLSAAGINGIFGNISAGGEFNRAVNLYAFGRLCADPSLTPEQIIDEYACKNATVETAAALAMVLRFVENHSNWHAKMPADYQLPALKTVATAAEALELLDTVVALPDDTPGLQETPAAFIARARTRVQAILQNE